MKICIVASSNYFSTYGGGQVYVKNLVSGLQTKGYEVFVISIVLVSDYDEARTEVVDFEGVKVWQIHLAEKNIDVNFSSELQTFILNTIKDVLTKIGPDIVHVNGWKYASAKVSKEIGVPCVVTAHHGGIVCPNGSLLNQYDAICHVPASMENCSQCALHFVPGGDFWFPFVRRLPYSFLQNIGKSLKNIRNIPYISPAFQAPLGISHKLEQIDVLRTASDCIIAPSHAIAAALVRNGIPEKQISIVPHGIIPLNDKALEKGLPERKLRFGYIGRISYVKGLHILIDALKLLPSTSNYELHVYGDAATKSEKNYAKTLKKKSKDLFIIWHGKVQYAKVQQAYHSFDVMILPSICLEVFGLTILESLSAGRPVIATRCGGPEDIIKDGVDGMLVEPNNAQDLARALMMCLNEPEYVKKLASGIGEVNTLESHLNELEVIYSRLQKKEI